MRERERRRGREGENLTYEVSLKIIHFINVYYLLFEAVRPVHISGGIEALTPPEDNLKIWALLPSRNGVTRHTLVVFSQRTM